MGVAIGNGEVNEGDLCILVAYHVRNVWLSRWVSDGLFPDVLDVFSPWVLEMVEEMEEDFLLAHCIILWRTLWSAVV